MSSSVVKPDSPQFRDLVAELRSRKSLTQEQLATELRVSFATINRWETGKTVPDNSTLHRLAEFTRSQGSDLGDLAGRFEQSSFSVPARTRRAKKKQADDESDTSVILDVKSMETMLWKAACSIRGEKDAPKFKDYILPLLFIKRLSDVFEDEVTILAGTYGNEELAREVLEADHSLVRFYIPRFATWPVIAGRQPYDWPENEKPKTLGEMLTTATRAIARENKTLQGVIDIVDFNETRNGEREISDAALTGIIELFSQPRYRLGLHNVESDFLGRAYEYLLRKFAEGQGQSAGEFFTPKEVGWLIAYLVKPQQGEEVYDPTCGSAGLLVKCELALLEQEKAAGREVRKPLKLYGQELTGSSYAIARMNMVLHDMEGEIARGNTMTNPRFLEDDKLKKFDIVVANPMWNQNNFSAENVYESDPFDRFAGGTPPESSADWGWLQHIAASLKEGGRAAVVLDTGAVSRGSGNQGENKEKVIRRWFVEQNLIDAVILLPDNLFYNTTAAGVIIVLRRGRASEEPIVLINASAEFQKGRPKNYLSIENVSRISEAFLARLTVEAFTKAASSSEVQHSDASLSPSDHVDTSIEPARRSIGAIIPDLAHRSHEWTNFENELSAELSLRFGSPNDQTASTDGTVGTWKSIRVEDAIIRLPERKPSIPTSAILSDGPYPVIDQGMQFVSGFTHDESSVYQGILPVVVFGDHTRILKFVDFEFATGADGTKLLKPDDRFDPKFFYFALRQIEIPNRGYNRHFRFLAESTFNYPVDKSEQRSIAKILSKVEASIKLQAGISVVLKELFDSTLRDLFCSRNSDLIGKGGEGRWTSD